MINVIAILKEKFAKHTYYGILKEIKRKLTLRISKQVMIESAINQMDNYDHRRHELSDWLAEL